MIKELTERQRRVLIYKANGNTDQQIATWMGIKPRSVSAMLQRIYRKLGASNAVQAVAIAIALGEIGVDEIYIPDEQREAA